MAAQQQKQPPLQSSGGSDSSSTTAAVSSAVTSGSSGDNSTPRRRETEFFATDPVSILDDIINAVEDYLWDGLDNLEKAIVSEEDLKPRQADVGKSIDSVCEKLHKAVAKNMDIFELYTLRNILSVPKHLVLQDDSGSQSQVGISAEAETKLDQDIDAVYRKVQAAKFMQHAMKTELTNIEGELNLYNRLRGESGADPFGAGDAAALTSQVTKVVADAKELAAAQTNLERAEATSALPSGKVSAEKQQSQFERDQSAMPLDAAAIGSFSSK